MKKILTFAISLLFLGLTVALAEGEPTGSSPVKSSKIEGKVLDMVTGEALAGVAVSIKDADLVAYTDFDGNYTFENLKPGIYNLVASFISYKNSLIENVEINPDQPREIIIQLQVSK
jgi:hypothetical protein